MDKDTRKQIVEVTVDGRPTEEEEASAAPSCPQPQSPSSTPVRILVEIRMSNGLHISQKNKNNWELVKLVEKLENYIQMCVLPIHLYYKRGKPLMGY